MDAPVLEPRVLEVAFPEGAVDHDAYDAVLRLQREGFTTYLVGGGVRDLLLGRAPKDFDISTAAEPRVVRRLFRNARVIGRRFQIVHLRYGNRIFEVSCFRKREEPLDGGMREPLAAENNYGTPRDDAFARDFTVNALFYDPVKKLVIDHVGGLPDLDAAVLRSVGVPSVWYYEDPVRILRAAKFAGRLGFELPERERAAMRERASLLHICPPSRVTEELFRILESGAAAPSYRILRETGVLDEVLPELTEPDRGGAHPPLVPTLELIDRLVVAHGGLPRGFLYAALFYPAAHGRCRTDGRARPWGAAVEDWLEPRCAKLHIPRSWRARQRTLMSLCGTLLMRPESRTRLNRLPRQAIFPDLMALLRLHQRLFDDVRDLYDPLRRRADDLGIDVVPSDGVRPTRRRPGEPDTDRTAQVDRRRRGAPTRRSRGRSDPGGAN
jgi:poly(A) polymerase